MSNFDCPPIGKERNKILKRSFSESHEFSLVKAKKTSNFFIHYKTCRCLLSNQSSNEI